MTPRLSIIRAQDFAWLLFVAALLWGTPETNYNATILIIIIGVFQIIEPRLKIFASRPGQFSSVAIKLVFSYLLVGYTHTIESPFFSIFLVPLVGAATAFDFAAVLVVTLIASLAYLSFLLPIYIDWNTYVPANDLYSILCLRISFFAIISFVVFEQARAKRIESERTKEANKSLQEAQASLRRSERLAALGQLTAGLAHELRNPLGTIKASAEMLNQQSTLEQPQLATEMASYIESEVDRMNGLITSFLNFARPLEIHPAPSDFTELMSDLVRRLSPLATSKQVTVTTSIAPEANQFNFDPSLLSIALSNLVQNAIQASPSGATVNICAKKAASEIQIVVQDHGVGISPQNLENIFNPFFTTKPDGVGLGLAIVSKIIDEHRGKITTNSTVGEGTTFCISLPGIQ